MAGERLIGGRFQIERVDISKNKKGVENV